MSGGSYDYVSFKIDDAVRSLRSLHPNEPHILALADHLDAISKVMHDIEWADSNDTSWTPQIDADVRALLHPGAELRLATERAEKASADLADVLDRARTPSTPAAQPETKP